MGLQVPSASRHTAPSAPCLPGTLTAKQIRASNAVINEDPNNKLIRELKDERRAWTCLRPGFSHHRQ